MTLSSLFISLVDATCIHFTLILTHFNLTWGGENWASLFPPPHLPICGTKREQISGQAQLLPTQTDNKNLVYSAYSSGRQRRVCNRKLCFLFLNKNICCRYSKELSHWESSFEHPKHMFKLMDKKIITILRWKLLLNWPYDSLPNLYDNNPF